MRVAVWALVIVVVGIGTLRGPLAIPTAHADPLSKPALAEARDHLALGNKLYNVRSFDEAVAEYKAGALIEPAPVFDYNLGQCYRLTGKYQEAIWHYERFLARGKPAGKLLDSVNDFMVQMRSELDKKAMTQKPTEPAPTAAPVASQPAPPPQARPLPVPPAVRRTEAWYRDGLGWGLAGAGVVGIAVGGGLLSNASSVRADANATKIQEDYHRLSDKASSRTVLGAAVGVVGAGLLVTGIVKLAIHTDEPAQVAGWSLGASGNGLMVFGQF
jgi:tetratricopeptide (TPR) repeat protein